VWNVTQFYVLQLEMYSSVTDFQIPSLSYANQTDDQKYKSSRILANSTLLVMKVHAVFCRNYARPDPAVPTVNNSTPSVPPAVTPPHSSLSLQTTYPFVSCCLFYDVISVWHCTVSSMIAGWPNGHDLSDMSFSQRCSMYSRYLVSYTASTDWWLSLRFFGKARFFHF